MGVPSEMIAKRIINGQEEHICTIQMIDRFRNKIAICDEPDTNYFVKKIGGMKYIDAEDLDKSDPIVAGKLDQIIAEIIDARLLRDQPIIDTSGYDMLSFLKEVRHKCPNNDALIIFSFWVDH